MPSRSRSKPHSGFVQTDLLFVAVLGLWLVLSASGLFEWSVGQSVLGFVAVLFAPGYALVSALFPAEKTRADSERPHADSSSGTLGRAVRNDGAVSVTERIVLAVGLSVCIVPFFGIGLAYVTGTIRPSLLLSALGTTTALLAALAVVRRWRVPASKQFSPRIFGHVRGVGTGLRTRSNVAVLLIVGLVVAGAGIGVAALKPDPGEEFTEFYLTTADSGDADGVAGEYPSEITLDGSEQVRVGITNREGEEMSYTVVVLLQALEDGEVQAVQPLDRFSVTVPQGATTNRTHTIGRDDPQMSGEDLRVTYLLYTGSAPSDPEPSTETAYRSVHIWVDVPE